MRKMIVAFGVFLIIIGAFFLGCYSYVSPEHKEVVEGLEERIEELEGEKRAIELEKGEIKKEKDAIVDSVWHLHNDLEKKQGAQEADER